MIMVANSTTNLYFNNFILVAYASSFIVLIHLNKMVKWKVLFTPLITSFVYITFKHLCPLIYGSKPSSLLFTPSKFFRPPPYLLKILFKFFLASFLLMTIFESLLSQYLLYITSQNLFQSTIYVYLGLSPYHKGHWCLELTRVRSFLWGQFFIQNTSMAPPTSIGYDSIVQEDVIPYLPMPATPSVNTSTFDSPIWIRRPSLLPILVREVSLPLLPHLLRILVITTPWLLVHKLAL